MRDQLLVVTGVPEVRQLKDMIPEILKQVGPKQYDQIKGLLAGEHAVKPTAAVAEDDDDDVPELVGGNFEQVAAAKWTIEIWDADRFQLVCNEELEIRPSKCTSFAQ